MKTLFALIAAALFASSAQADITGRVGVSSGTTISSYNMSIQLTSTDNVPVNAYVAAFDGKNIYWLTPSGWTTSNSATFPVAQALTRFSQSNGKFYTMLGIFGNDNLTGLNLTIYYGVGLDQNDMIAKNQIWSFKIGKGAQ